MEDVFYKLIMKNSPMAFAYHKILLDESGEPCDYVFLEVNHAFEEMTGLNGKQIIGKRVTEVIPGIREEEFDCVAAYGLTALQGGRAEYEQYSDILGRWYRIQVYSPERYYFAVNFLDVTKEKQQAAESEELLKQLQEKELQFHSIIDRLPFSLCINRLNGIILYINTAGKELFQIEGESIHEKSTLLFWVNKKDRLQFIHALEEKGMVKDFEMYLQTQKGKRFWAMGSSIFIKYQNEHCILTVQHDITERKNMENALRISEEKFRLIFENAAESILIVQNNKMQMFNSMAQKTTGYSPEEMLRLPFVDFFHPEDRDYAASCYHDRLAGKSISGKPQYRITRKDGEILWIEANGVKVTWNGHPAIQYFIIDITEQKKAEDALKASEEKYRLITEFASDMIWVFNYTNYKFTYVSPSIFHMLGYQPEEALQLSLNELIPEEFLHQIEQRNIKHAKEFQENSQESRFYIMEMQNIRKNGQHIWVEISSRYRYNSKQEIEIIGVSRNIEERRNAEQKVLYLSYHDQLTGLYNRRFYEEELKRLDTPENLPITLVLADVNGLKLTNDAFGHLAGDQLLIHISNILPRECRKYDIIARIGGDEFVILMPRTGTKEADEVISRIKRAMAAGSSDSSVLSVSFGYATKAVKEQDMENVFVEAENTMYQHKLNESSSMRNKTIKIITQVFYSKSKREEAHNKRVGKLSGEIAKAMGMREEDINEVITAGSLHDIGKIGMEEKLFEKQEPLTEQEWIEYKRHPEIGYQILKSSNEFTHIAQYVLCHHERTDGLGYPRGIIEKDIPIQARILSLADAYDRMLNPRTYKKGMGEEAAVREIIKNAGTQFDETVARIFVEKVLHKPWREA
ncbi:PAS domain S-box protein [Anaerocolumna xylanovorans]|nr:PAS domain S-box protein [Anaerocolumna xylanovorans]